MLYNIEHLIIEKRKRWISIMHVGSNIKIIRISIDFTRLNAIKRLNNLINERWNVWCQITFAINIKCYE